MNEQLIWFLVRIVANLDLILNGVAVWRSGALPKWAGYAEQLGGPSPPVAAIGARFMAADSANLALPAWRGFHHVALVMRDLDATMRFYTEVLGMEIMFVAPAGELHGCHCSIRPGSESDRLGLHFFEYPHAPHTNPHDQSLEATVFDPGPTFLSHISFALPSEEAGVALRERLTSYGIPMTPMLDQGDLRNMVFLDDNGMALEAI